jgi:hypothetical protein
MKKQTIQKRLLQLATWQNSNKSGVDLQSEGNGRPYLIENNVFTKRRFFCCAVYFLCFWFAPLLQAQQQTDLIQYKKRTEIGFDTTQEQKLNRIISNPLYKAHYYVNFQNLVTHHVDGVITVNLPATVNSFLSPGSNDIDGDGVTNDADESPYDPCMPNENNASCAGLRPSTYIQHTFYPLNIQRYSESEYMYYGATEPCGDEAGYIHLIARGGRFFGQINLEEEVWEIFDLGFGKNVLVNWNNSAFPSDECAHAHDGPVTDSLENSFSERSTTTFCEVRVLVLFTANAELVADPLQRANLGIQQSNDIAQNSKAGVRFTLAGVELLPGFNEVVNNLPQTHDNFRALYNGLPTMLRNGVNADLVVLFVDTDDPFFAGASQLDDWGAPEMGSFVTVEIDAANGRFTFTHELAHDFGCKHNNDNRGVPDFVFEARGNIFQTGFIFLRDRRTVMALLPEGEARIMNWSNPEVKFRKKPTGTDTRHNALQMSDMACPVSLYRQATPFAALVNGPIEASSLSTNTYCLAIDNCNQWTSGPWEFSFNGFDYTAVSGSQNALCVNMQMPVNGTLFIRVNVTCQGGETLTLFFTTYNNDAGNPLCGDEGEDRTAASEIVSGLSSGVEINPNPVNSHLFVRFDLEQSGEVRIAIFDIMGKQLMAHHKDYLKGENVLVIDTGQLKMGSYVVIVEKGNERTIKRFVKF